MVCACITGRVLISARNSWKCLFNPPPKSRHPVLPVHKDSWYNQLWWMESCHRYLHQLRCLLNDENYRTWYPDRYILLPFHQAKMQTIADDLILTRWCVQYCYRVFLSQSYFFCFAEDRKSTRLNSSHITISYAVFCL